MTCTSDFEPRFQAQNPAISGDKYGWENCAAYAGAEAASYSTCGAVNVTGAQVRAATNEPIPDPASPGLNIIQVTDALAKFGVTVTPFTRMSWANVTYLRSQGHAFSLCGQYSVLRATRFSGDPNFYGGHQVYYPPSGKTQDPLCDGRRAGIYKYHGEVYPDDLMERFCGAFRVVVGGHATNIGIGWAQGFYTTSHPSPDPVPPPKGGDMAISSNDIGLTSSYVVHLSQGQVFYATPATDRPVTKMSADGDVRLFGTVIGAPYYAVGATTAGPYTDGKARYTQLYVPTSVGAPVKR